MRIAQNRLARIVPLVLALAAALPVFAETDAPVTVLRGLDPVELAAGREVPGQPGIDAVRGQYRYLFANDQNRQRFVADGERYAVQIGGACAKMGPLSGKGSPDRFLVHEGRIFLFASDSCREAFRAAPEKFLDRADPPPVGTPAEARRAAELLDQAIAAIGGAERLRDLVEVKERRRVSGESGAKPYSHTETILLGFPESIRVIDDYGGSTYGWALEPEGGVLFENGELTPAEPSVTEFVRREYYRHPLALLKAWQRGDVIAFARPPAPPRESAVERIAMHAGGATTTLGLDPATGRVVEVTYRGRITRGISDVVLRFADFREVHGIFVPFRIERWADGAVLTQPRVEIESVEVLARDHELDQIWLGHELDVTALTSLALVLLDNGEVERAKAMLLARLAEAVRAADELTAAGTTLTTTAPNLLAALGRAADHAATRDPATADAARRTRMRLQAGDERTPSGAP